MTKKKITILGLSTVLAAGLFASLIGASQTFGKLTAEDCVHNKVEHYSENFDHVEHWACCECHTAWSDSTKTNVIGNTISDRTKIDVPCEYWYDRGSKKIEHGRNKVALETITPVSIISNMKFHANNPNVIQFEAADNLEKFETTNLTILNPKQILDTFGLDATAKSTFVYWSDSHTFGFQQGGAFANPAFGKFVVGSNLVLTSGEKYYVVELVGAVYSSAKLGIMETVAGAFLPVITPIANKNNYELDLLAEIKTDFWSVNADSVGTDWTYGGGTSYQFNKISAATGEESVYAKVTSETANGTFPAETMKEATLYVRNQKLQTLRLQFEKSAFVKGDKLILKAGSIFTDDANGKDAVLATEDIIFYCDGERITESPLTYSYNETSKKIEVKQNGKLRSEIVPDKYISALQFHNNNNNVMQFKGQGSLEEFATKDLTVLNPENVYDTFGLTDSTKSTLVYWSDSHTFGFQQGGAFATFGFGKYVEADNLVLTDGSKHCVVGIFGVAASPRIGIFVNVCGYMKSNVINSFIHNDNYVVDIEIVGIATFWLGGDYTGTDWTVNGGTFYVINQISSTNISSVYTQFTGSSPENGHFPDNVGEATVMNMGTTNTTFIRFQFTQASLTGDVSKLEIATGSMLNDNKQNAIIAKTAITLKYNKGSATPFSN